MKTNSLHLWQVPHCFWQARQNLLRRRCCSGRTRRHRSKNAAIDARSGAEELSGRRRLPAARTRVPSSPASRPKRRPVPVRSASSAGCMAISPARSRYLGRSQRPRPHRRQRQPGLHEAGQARRHRAEVPAVDAGELRDGGQQAGAAIPAGRRRHQQRSPTIS